jgi:uncharacterized protein with PIN domain
VNGELWQRRATFRFYEELNDFLPPARRKVAFEHAFKGSPSVKDTIESLGVPHPEIDLILVDGLSVGFDYRLQGGERVAVYPVFERLEIDSINRLRPEPLRRPRFVLDAHLGKLTRLLRLLGFDALHDPEYRDARVAELGAAQGRIVVTRDRDLLKRSAVTRGHWLRSSSPWEQLSEIVDSFDLRERARPFTRCLVCNGALESVAEAAVHDRLPPGVRGQFKTLARCPQCGRVYWRGSHYRKLAAKLDMLLGRGSAVARAP